LPLLFQRRDRLFLLADAGTKAELRKESDHPGNHEANKKEQKGP